MTKRNAEAVQVSGDDDPLWKTAGAYWFVSSQGKRIGMMFACPCGCGAVGMIGLEANGWTLTDDPLNATPSIGFSRKDDGSYHWHGFLRNGVFEEC